MSNQLQENLNLILEEKNTKLLPENLKAGITCLGVTGSYEGEGDVDTSDATATANDIASGKTAYVNGEKVEGTVYTEETGDTLSLSSGHITEVKVPIDSNDLIVKSYFSRDMLFRAFSYLQTNIPADKIVNAIGLTADKLVEGVTVLGITGTGGSQ